MRKLTAFGLGKLFLLGIVLAAGSMAGSIIYLSYFTAHDVAAESFRELPLDTGKFKTGQLAPEFAITDLQNKTAMFSHRFQNQTVVLAILSAGCLPCDEFIDFVRYELSLQDRPYSTVLVSLDPDYYRPKATVPVYGISIDDLDRLGIDTYPSIIGISKSGQVVFSHPVFRTMITSAYLDSVLAKY